MSAPPPARNESFLLQIRNYIEQRKFDEAESLLQIMESDIYFPARLKTSWNEYNAYLLYNEKQYDSAAYYLIKALPNALNQSETARWEYLIGQLFAISSKDSLSTLFFERAIKHTNDPLMDIYARLNIVALNADNQKDALNYHLSQLLAMAKKEKFQQYRDLIYYAAAELEIRQKQYKQAEELLKKSIQFNDGNIIQKSKSYYLISETQYKLKKYIDASNSHDSITIILLNNTAANNIDFKKGPLKKIALALIAVNREDSLQRIASYQKLKGYCF